MSQFLSGASGRPLSCFWNASEGGRWPAAIADFCADACCSGSLAVEMAIVSSGWRLGALSLAVLGASCPAWAQDEAGASVSLSAGADSGKADADGSGAIAGAEYHDDGLDAPESTPALETQARDESERAEPRYLDRYKPTGNLWEVGLTTGLLFPAPDHNLKVAALPGEPYSDVSAVIGGRLAYYPLSFLGVEAEAMVSPSATQNTNKSALLYAARGHLIAQLPILSVVPFALVGGGMLGGISQSMGNDGDPAFHFGVGVKVPVHRVVGIRLDLRDTLTQKRDGNPGDPTNSFEVLLGATFTFERPCPEPPAHRPPPPSPVPVSEKWGDGLHEPPPEPQPITTECPEGSIKGNDGCVLADADHDGIPLPADQCPDAPETKNGFEDEDGCPDVLPEAVQEFTGVIPGISFKQGKSEVSPASYPALDKAAEVLAQYPDIVMEISGHTSSEGKAEVNQKLSEDRANAVATYLESKGIPRERLVVRGAGSSEPIADNATREGREKNRRIEFRVLGR